MAPAAVVATHGLTKRYEGATALDHLDLEVPPACIFGYLGPNGAGKSTTLRLLMGLLRPTEGSATVLGLDVVTDRDALARRVGYLPGDFTAYRDLTGRQYLRYLADLRDGAGRDRIEPLAERLGLELGRRIGALSHGNRQKVGIVQAVMHEPELLVLDEPTQGLDPLVQHTFLDLLREQRDAGRTVLMSSHVLSEVEEVADTVAIIRAGHLVAVSAVDELKQRTRRRVELVFEDPATAPVAELAAVPGVVDVVARDGAVHLVVEGSMAALLRAAAPHGVERIIANEVDLESVFLEYYEEPGP